MESPPPEFFEALKFYPELEKAKELLKGEDAYSKSLLALILTRISEDNDAQVAEMLPTIDTSGNDIAMMLCFMTYDVYRLETTKAKNLIFKRFGKAEVQADVEAAPAAPEAETPEAEAAPAAPEAETPEAEAAAVAPEAAPEAEAPEAEAAPEAPASEAREAVDKQKSNAIPEAANPNVKPNSPQKGGSKKKRPSKLRKTKKRS